ncbi:DUF732 domain-containing protein [Rhodococcus sp. NM-2]|uniref:DUF732 domain-containing protein n=1 Tax=Rhodococcus sp. NM-2 TaxID=3401174 RepID=UPI003AAB9A65
MDIGRSLCNSLIRGNSTRSLIIEMQNTNYEPEEIGVYLGAATSVFCPAYYSRVERDIQTLLPGS